MKAIHRVLTGALSALLVLCPIFTPNTAHAGSDMMLTVTCTGPGCTSTNVAFTSGGVTRSLKQASFTVPVQLDGKPLGVRVGSKFWEVTKVTGSQTLYIDTAATTIKPSTTFKEVGGLCVESSQLKLAEQILFDVDKTTIRPESFRVLNAATHSMKDHPDMKVRIEAHADSTGSPTHNQTLSEGRGNSVKYYLVSQGVEESRLTVVGYGETQPIADNNTASGRAQNRRVVFQITDGGSYQAQYPCGEAPKPVVVAAAAPPAKAAPKETTIPVHVGVGFITGSNYSGLYTRFAVRLEKYRLGVSVIPFAFTHSELIGTEVNGQDLSPFFTIEGQYITEWGFLGLGIGAEQSGGINLENSTPLVAGRGVFQAGMRFGKSVLPKHVRAELFGEVGLAVGVGQNPTVGMISHTPGRAMFTAPRGNVGLTLSYR